MSELWMDDGVAMDTVDATQPTVAMEPVGVSRPAVVAEPAGGTQPMAGVQPAIGTEPCAHCGAPLARDQRYCLECGTPRTYLSGMLLERLRVPSAQGQPAQATAVNGALPNGSGGSGAAGLRASPSSSPWQRGNALTLIAGIGVLLLAMGVGVLIGRSGGSSSPSTPAPQVISVGGAGAGAAAGSTSTTPVTPEATSTTPAAKAGSGSSTTTSKAKALTPGVGAVPSKPAPPTVLKNLRKKSGNGESFEQKSKNLPDVVETG